MSLRSCSVEARFSKAAPYYSQGAVVQEEIAKLVTERALRVSGAARSVLDVGCGTGFVVRELLNANLDASLLGVDISRSMIETARAEFAGRTDVQWLCADARRCSFGMRFDLIVSSSAIQWMRPFGELFSNLKLHALEGARLCLSLMVEGTLAELYAIRREIAPEKSSGIVLPSGEEIAQALVQSGWQLVARERITRRQTYSSATECFRSIRQLGFTGRDSVERKNLLSRRELDQLVQLYQTRYQDAGGLVPATYCSELFEAIAVGAAG